MGTSGLLLFRESPSSNSWNRTSSRKEGMDTKAFLSDKAPRCCEAILEKLSVPEACLLDR
jgi:hypothetical protein